MTLPPVIGHRGSPVSAPENTLPSFAAAGDAGAKWVEFDVRLSADLRPIVFHDDTLERTSDGVGPVAARPLEELAGLDAGIWFSEKFAGTLIPTLEETLDLLLDLKLGFNIELKPVDGRDRQLTEIACEVMDAMWPASAPAPMISSFSYDCIAAAKDVAPARPRALCLDVLSDGWQNTVAPLDLTALSINALALKKKTVADIHDAGLKIAAWTVNTTDRANVLWDLGVESLFTDDPARMVEAHKKRHEPS